MNSLLLTDVSFDSSEAWENFTLIHGISHQSVYQGILQIDALENIPTYYPLFDFPREENADYLLDHWRVHVSNAQLLGLPGIPDLSTVDLTSESQYADWLAQHALVHLNENAALGFL